jgi:hypothetical protein
MVRKYWLIAMLLALGVVLLASFGTGQAARLAAGSGPADAVPVPDDWQTLKAGQSAWYAFKYAGDRSDVLVRVSAGPAGSAKFAVWSPADVIHWSLGEAVDPTGRGSANAAYGGDLIWAGAGPSAGTWYVVMEPSGGAQTWYNLQISGSGVGHSPTATPTVPPAKTPAPPAVGAGTSQQATSVPTATRFVTRDPALAFYNPATPTPTRPAQYPASALPLPDGPQTLGAGQHVWYAFQYPGDRSQIKATLHADPPGSANFTVWSWDVLQRWQEGYFYTPTGRGTASKVDNGDLTWTGGSIIKGKWYIIVEQNGTSPTSYTLEVSGTGVERTLPPTAVPTPTYSLPLPAPGSYR